MEIRKYGRNWAVYDDDAELVCVTVYKKGAIEVVRRLDAVEKVREVITHVSFTMDQSAHAHP